MKLHCGEFGLRCFSLFSKQTIFPRKRHSWRAKKALRASFYLHGHHKLIINDDCDDDDDDDDDCGGDDDDDDDRPLAAPVSISPEADRDLG